MRAPLAFVLPLLAACFTPRFEAGLDCSPTGECPPAYFCEPNTRTCHPDGTGGVGFPSGVDFSSVPAVAVQGHRMPPVRVRIVDSAGERVLTATGNVTISMQNEMGQIVALSGTLTRPALMGEAVFDELFAPELGTFRLFAGSGVLDSALSGPVQVRSFAFGAAQTTTLAYPADHAAVGDLNGDGRADLVITESGQNLAHVSLADADGTLIQLADVPAGLSPHVVAIGDVDLDGVPDLIIGTGLGDAVGFQVFTGDGGGVGFSTSATRVTVTPIADLHVTDIDGDDKPDIAVVVEGSIDVWWNDTPTAGATPEFSFLDLHCDGINSQAVRAVRFDSLDGVVDLVSVGDLGACTVRGDGSLRGFLPQQLASIPPAHYHDLAIGDLDGDGRLDAFTVDSSVSYDRIRQSSGDGTLGGPTLLATTGSGGAVAIADLDSDGRDDAVIADAGGQLSVLRQRAPGQFDTTTQGIPTGSFLVTVTDVNGDDILDVVTVTPASVSVLVGL